MTEELVTSAPDSSKTESLTEKATDLAAAENTIPLTSERASHEVKNASRPQLLFCAAYWEYTAEMPEASMPPIVKLMWVHEGEPDADSEVLDFSGTLIGYRVQAEDARPQSEFHKKECSFACAIHYGRRFPNEACPVWAEHAALVSCPDVSKRARSDSWRFSAWLCAQQICWPYCGIRGTGSVGPGLRT